jgi:hypothetical protein
MVVCSQMPGKISNLEWYSAAMINEDAYSGRGD